MLFVKIKRIIRSGFVSFWRNGFVSLSSILIMIVTLAVIGGVIFLKAGLTSSLQALRERVDINIYFTIAAPEDKILALKTSLEARPEVAKVEYVSRDQALADFKKKHEGDQLTLRALDELVDNPLEASLAVHANDTSQYAAIAKFLESADSISQSDTPIIDKVNYYENREAIDRLTHIIDTADKLGLLISIAFVVISVLITFNTIRLVIFISRAEIAVMKLVGASNTYIRGPFVVGGTMYGLVAALVTLAMLWPAAYYLGPKTAIFFLDLDIYHYFTANILQISGILVGSGMAIGAVSSFLAVRKHLKV